MFNNDYSALSQINSVSQNITTSTEDSVMFDYDSFYRAYVIDNNDPKGLGRVKVRIPVLHGIPNNNSTAYIKNNDLPWAFPAIFAGAGNQMGSVILPEVGTLVWVTFEYEYNKSNSHIIYFGGIITNLDKEVQKTIKSYRDVNSGYGYLVESNDLPEEISTPSQKIIYKSLKGHTIMTDDADGAERIEIIDASNQRIIMCNNSDIVDKLGRRTSSTEPSKNSFIKLMHNKENYIILDDEGIKFCNNGEEINLSDILNRLN